MAGGKGSVLCGLQGCTAAAGVRHAYEGHKVSWDWASGQLKLTNTVARVRNTAQQISLRQPRMLGW